MGRKKGICTLCGKGGKLTFEHVPAEGSGNQRGITVHTLEEWLARDGTPGALPGGILQPEGLGLLALCAECNVDLLGKQYVPAFIDFVTAGKQLLGDIAADLGTYDSREQGTMLGVQFHAVNRLAVAKQIVSMALVTAGRRVVERNPTLAAFVRTPTARGVPPDYRLFLSLTPGPAAKVTGLSVRLEIPTGIQVLAAEVVYPPFAYALSFNGTAVYSSGEITDWMNADYGAVTEAKLQLPLGFCYTVLPGDLRNAAQVERTRRENTERTKARRISQSE